MMKYWQQLKVSSELCSFFGDKFSRKYSISILSFHYFLQFNSLLWLGRIHCVLVVIQKPKAAVLSFDQNTPITIGNSNRIESKQQPIRPSLRLSCESCSSTPVINFNLTILALSGTLFFNIIITTIIVADFHYRTARVGDRL